MKKVYQVVWYEGDDDDYFNSKKFKNKKDAIAYAESLDVLGGSAHDIAIYTYKD